MSITPCFISGCLIYAALQGGVLPQEPVNPAVARVMLTQSEIERRTNLWLTKYRRFVQKTTLGKTREGRPIHVFKIDTHSPKNREHKETVLLAGIHPREQQPSQNLIRFIDELLSRYGNDTQVTDTLDRQVLWVIPSFNVDGKIHDETERDWRKNRVPNDDGSFGVDLNRNFAVRWGGGRLFDTTWKTTTTVPSSNIYEGSSPLSEPETKALAGFFEAHPRIVAFLDIHSPLREILFPPYATLTDGERMLETAVAMQKAQQNGPYKITKAAFGSEPPEDERSGNSGLTYHHAYYLRGIFGFNFEISNPERTTGLSGRYPSIESADVEYEKNVRDAWLVWLNHAPTFPLMTLGNARARGEARTLKPARAGTVFGWLPPEILGDVEWAILTSDDPRIQCVSEIRRAPFKNPFTLRISVGVPTGSRLELRLTVWGTNKSRTVITVPLLVQ